MRAVETGKDSGLETQHVRVAHGPATWVLGPQHQTLMNFMSRGSRALVTALVSFAGATASYPAHALHAAPARGTTTAPPPLMDAPTAKLDPLDPLDQASPSRGQGAGDSLLIPAHCRHRVAHTAARTVWLALHFGEDPA